MNRIIAIISLIFFSMMGLSAQSTQTFTFRLLETSDVHGSYLPYDFINRRAVKGSLASVHTYANELRRQYGDKRVLLLDNGDILQGQPIAYYYNYIDTVAPHVTAEMLNYMRYDVGNMGNHDVETGHAVYDRWIAQCRFPILGANIIYKGKSHGKLKTNQPYLPPYQVFDRDGVRIVVLGMITPAIPSWLPENLWKDLYFADMEETARRQVADIRRRLHPDILIGLFHSGSAGNRLDTHIENASRLVAQRIPGFDVVFMGHDHLRQCEKVVNVAGDSVLIIDPANAAKSLSDVTIRVVKQGKRLLSKSVSGTLVDLTKIEPDADFVEKFRPQFEAVKAFVERPIGEIDRTISAQDAFFGPSAFVDLIHRLQLDLTGAQVSFCAPLSPNAVINEGKITVADMFNLYKFENMLYTMRLTGKEIKDFLEMSYAIWTNRMKSADDHIILLNDKDKGFGRFKNPTFNFDSAAGLIYTVDVTQPEGQKISILRMADGQPFELEKTYLVAVNSYRGNGGGDLLTKGAGIPKSELAKRIVNSTDKDLRYYLMKRIEVVKQLRPVPLNQWKFVPEAWAEQAVARDRELLFGKMETKQSDMKQTKIDKGVEMFEFPNMKLTWVQDNAAERRMPLSLFGQVDEAIVKELNIADGLPASMSTFLLEVDGKRILFDTGLGAPDSRLLPSLANLGIRPEDIQLIYLTHFHGDHIGGLLKDGKKVFPNATLYAARMEYDGWMKMAADKKEQVVRIMKAYAGQLHLFDFDDVLPGGVKALKAIGHTPGHTAFEVGKVLIVGDLFHGFALQSKYPQYSAAYDMNPAQAEQSRRYFLQYAKEKGLLMAGMHMPEPGVK